MNKKEGIKGKRKRYTLLKEYVSSEFVKN